MPCPTTSSRAVRRWAGPAPALARALAVATVLLLGAGCGAGTGGAADGPEPLPEDAYQRALAQGVDPALVHTIELPGFALAPQSAGVLGDTGFGATYVPSEPSEAPQPPATAEVHLEVVGGPYDPARCARDPLRGPSGGAAVAVEACEPDEHGWYRTGGDRHEYVVRGGAHHLVVGAPSDVVDRATLTQAALGARRQDGTSLPPPSSPSSPVPRGDLPSTGDGAPVDPGGASPPGG